MSYVTTTFADHPSAQCRVLIYDNNDRELMSYSTRVLYLNNKGWLTCYGTFSACTRKHIGWFMHEFVPAPLNNYYIAKGCFDGHYKINVNTGEKIDL